MDDLSTTYFMNLNDKILLSLVLTGIYSKLKDRLDENNRNNLLSKMD